MFMICVRVRLQLFLLVYVWGCSSSFQIVSRGPDTYWRPQSSPSISKKFWLTRNLDETLPSMCLHTCLMNVAGILWLPWDLLEKYVSEDLPGKSLKLTKPRKSQLFLLYHCPYQVVSTESICFDNASSSNKSISKWKKAELTVMKTCLHYSCMSIWAHKRMVSQTAERLHKQQGK